LTEELPRMGWTAAVKNDILAVKNGIFTVKTRRSMKLSSSISSKGQVTIPQEIRKRLGVGAGDRIDFVVEEGKTVIRPSRSDENPFDKYRGALGPFPGGHKGIKTWIDEMRTDEE
jgi:antitoxin PrlF